MQGDIYGMGRVALALLLVISTSVSPGLAQNAAPSQCAAGSLVDSVSPSREGFFREVLYAVPTRRTPRFDDYTPGSYHADKQDLAVGLPIEATRCGLRLRALLVVGPIGPLWTFHVIPFIQDADSLRVNSLVMPHARITGKGTARIGEQALSELVSDLTRSALVKPGLPAFPDSLREPLGRDFSYNLLLVVYAPGESARYWHATFWEAMRGDNAESAHLERVLETINRVLGATNQTYGHGMPRQPDTVPP